MDIKVSDYIIDFFINNDINKVFSVTGGFAMFLNDSIASNKNIDVIYQHHEQASGYSAMGYTKTSLKPCIVCTTAGCGITNTISCINSAWQDNVPIIFLCGQSKSIDTVDYYKKTKNITIRNGFGSDCDIINIVKDITKYAIELTDINNIEYELSKALYLCENGRKGPVLISVPIDLQGQKIKLDNLNLSYIPDEINQINTEFVKLKEIEDEYKKCKRPLILIGGGINSNNTYKDLFINYNDFKLRFKL